MKRPLVPVALASLFFVVSVAFVAAKRIAFPYDVEWMEGGVLMQAERMLRGESAYPPPSATFVPFFYPPLYPALLAALGHVDYAFARALSFGATMGAVVLAAVAVQRATRRPELAILTVGLASSFAGLSGHFFDVVRPDALAYALVMGAAVLAVRGGPARLVLAGLFLAAACFAKQTAFVCGLGVIAGVALTRERRAVLFVAASAALTGLVAFASVMRATEGRFAAYVLGGHTHHAFYRQNLTFFAFRDVLHLAPVVIVLPLVWWHRVRPRSLGTRIVAAGCVLALVDGAVRGLPPMFVRDLPYAHAFWAVPVVVAALAVAGTGRVSDPTPAQRYWGAVFFGALVAAALGHATQWAYKNAFLPLAILGTPFLVLVVHALAESKPAASRWLAGLLALQLVALYEPPSRQAPTAEDRASWDRLRVRVAAMPGKVMVLAHPRLSFEVGGVEHLHAMSIQDLASAGGVPDLEARLAAHEWSAIVTDLGDGVDAPPLLARYYEVRETVEAPRMKTGSSCRPRMLWVPR